MARLLAAFLGFLLGLLLAGNIEAGVKAGPVVHPGGHHRLKAPSGALDLVSAPAAGAYGFRKLKSTYAGKAVRLFRTSDSVQQDIGFTASGDFDTAAATAFCGAGCTIQTWYDQSGNGRDVTNTNQFQQANLIFNCLGTKPCSRSTVYAAYASVATVTPASPLTISAVANRIGTTNHTFITVLQNNYLYANSGNVNEWRLFGNGGAFIAGTAADSAWHTGIAVFNAAASVLRVDSTETTGTVSIDAAAGTIGVAGGNAGLTLSMTEALVWSGYALTPAERAALSANQKQYWGF